MAKASWDGGRWDRALVSSRSEEILHVATFLYNLEPVFVDDEHD